MYIIFILNEIFINPIEIYLRVFEFLFFDRYYRRHSILMFNTLFYEL